MPLKSGKSNKVVNKNISEMMHSKTFGKGKSEEKKHKMAIAAALQKARDSKKKA